MRKRMLSCISALLLIITAVSCADEIKVLPYSDLIRYGDLGMSKNTPVQVEVVIGETSGSGFMPETDIWIRDSNGYGLRSTFSLPAGFTTGQRYLLTITPYSDGSFGKDQIVDSSLLEENVNVEEILTVYKSQYDPLPYKKVLRNPDNYQDSYFLVEGVYFQDLGGNEKLLIDADENVYYFYYNSSLEGLNLLLDDHLRLYCQLSGKDNGLYSYQSWTGVQTVPRLMIDFIDLLEEE